MKTTTVLDLYDVSSVTLWVEDHLTRVFLNIIWGASKIRISVGGGRDGVESLVAGAPKNLKGRTVVGLVDRDFSQDNENSWGNVDCSSIRTPTHEFENLLLDFDVLADLSKEPAAAIRAKAHEFARSMKWWMACKRVRHEISLAMTAHFPEEPAIIHVPDQQAATDHLMKSTYWKEHKGAFATYTNEKYLAQRIVQEANHYDSDLATDNWLQSFSGKEIFRHVRTVVPRFCDTATGRTPAEKDENLAKRIAEKLSEGAFAQSETRKVFERMKAALFSRAQLKP